MYAVRIVTEQSIKLRNSGCRVWLFLITLVEIFHSKLNKVAVGCTEECLLQKLQRFSLTQTLCSELATSSFEKTKICTKCRTRLITSVRFGSKFWKRTCLPLSDFNSKIYLLLKSVFVHIKGWTIRKVIGGGGGGKIKKIFLRTTLNDTVVGQTLKLKSSALYMMMCYSQIFTDQTTRNFLE